MPLADILGPGERVRIQALREIGSARLLDGHPDHPSSPLVCTSALPSLDPFALTRRSPASAEWSRSEIAGGYMPSDEQRRRWKPFVPVCLQVRLLSRKAHSSFST